MRFVTGVSLVVCCTMSGARAGEFNAGAAVADITPNFPISVNGGMTDRTAQRAHDRLHARCIVLDDGRTKIAIAVSDSCMIPREILDEAKGMASKKTGIPVANMLCSATHTHTAPTAGPVFQSKPDPAYLSFLAKRIAEGIIAANANAAPARVGWSAGKNTRQVFNRRWHLKPGEFVLDPFGKQEHIQMNPPVESPKLERPAGPTDPEVSLLAVSRRDGTPVAVLGNYSLHYVGDVPPNGVSADYFGEFALALKELIPGAKDAPGFVGIMSNGTSGDANNINFQAKMTPSAPYTRCRAVARSLAETAKDAYEKIQWRSDVTLASAVSEIELGVRLPSEADIARAKEILAKAKNPILTTLPEIYANETVAMATYPSTVTIPLQAIRIGELGIVAIPCEVFTEIGLAIKKNSPLRPTFTIELANGYYGYLPTPGHHALGGYETWRARSSYLAADSSPKVEAEVLRLLSIVKSKSE